MLYKCNGITLGDIHDNSKVVVSSRRYILGLTWPFPVKLRLALWTRKAYEKEVAENHHLHIQEI